MAEVIVGSVVHYVDQHSVTHNALVTAVWNGEYGSEKKPGLNLVYVAPENEKHDTWGRQIERVSSIPHRDAMPAPGNYWYEI
jgi:hypothetical protein